MFADYEALQAWPLVTAHYSGIEQALKGLLLTPTTPRFTLDELRSREFGNGHDLARFYDELDERDREHIERHFREHWTLYDYALPEGVVIDTAEDFIVHLNGGRPSRGLSWRYFLIDASVQLPSTNLGAMSEVWDAICCCIGRASGRQGCSSLRQRLVAEFSRVITGRPTPYDGYCDDRDAWLAYRNGDHLAAWVDLLVQGSRGAIHEVRTPDRLRSELASLAEAAIKRLSESNDPDMAQLLRRIQHPDQAFAWNPSNSSFLRQPFS